MRQNIVSRWKKRFIGYFTKKNDIEKKEKFGLLDDITYGNY